MWTGHFCPVFECLTLWNWKAWHSCDQYLSFKSVFSLVCVLFAGLHQNWSESKGSSCWTLNKRKRTSMLRQVGYYGRIRRMGQMQMGIDCWWFAVSSCSALFVWLFVYVMGFQTGFRGPLGSHKGTLGSPQKCWCPNLISALKISKVLYVFFYCTKIP